jgi:hypothetical protein
MSACSELFVAILPGRLQALFVSLGAIKVAIGVEAVTEEVPCGERVYRAIGEALLSADCPCLPSRAVNYA